MLTLADLSRPLSHPGRIGQARFQKWIDTADREAMNDNCKACGASVSTAYCANCGAASGVATAAGPDTAPTSAGEPSQARSGGRRMVAMAGVTMTLVALVGATVLLVRPDNGPSARSLAIVACKKWDSSMGISDEDRRRKAEEASIRFAERATAAGVSNADLLVALRDAHKSTERMNQAVAGVPVDSC